MLWSPSVRRMFFTLVPFFNAPEAPLTGRSFTTTTLSPSCSTLPFASFTSTLPSTTSSSGFHSWPHSGQAKRPLPLGYPYGELHSGQGNNSSDICCELSSCKEI